MSNPFKELFDYKSPESRGEQIFYRIFELTIIFFAVKYAWEWGFYMDRISDIVLPLGIANYIDVSFMFGSQLPMINAMLITGLLACGYSRTVSRYAYFMALILLHLQYTARFTLGEIPHSANLIGMTLLCFALAHVFFNDPKIIRRFSMGSVYFFCGLGYTSAGISKLVGTGLNWIDGRHLWLWMSEKSVDILSRTGTFEFNWLQEVAFEHHLIATLILLSGLLVELSGIAMWWKKLRPFIITLIMGTHIGIQMTMNIVFMAFMVQLLLMAYPWPKLIDQLLDYAKTFSIKGKDLKAS
ncbi:MAG: hypothetical protein WEB89_01345 [Balneolales bacterium]